MKNKYKTSTICLITIIVMILVASISFCGYYAYKYYTYPNVKSVHCYANNDDRKLDVYYSIKNDTVIRKVEVGTYNYSETILNKLKKDFDDKNNGKYQGYMYKLWNSENEIVTMKLYDYERLSESELKELLNISNKEEYLMADDDFYTSGYSDKGFTCVTED